MRKIELVKFESLKFAAMPTYREILKEAINRPMNAQRGFDAEDMRSSVKLLDKLEAANSTFDLEDAEWEIVKKKVNDFPFAIADKELVKFIDAVNEAPEVSGDD